MRLISIRWKIPIGQVGDHVGNRLRVFIKHHIGYAAPHRESGYFIYNFLSGWFDDWSLPEIDF